MTRPCEKELVQLSELINSSRKDRSFLEAMLGKHKEALRRLNVYVDHVGKQTPMHPEPVAAAWTNHIYASATDEFIAFILEHGITLEQAAAARQIASDAHNREETPNSLPASSDMRLSRH